MAVTPSQFAEKVLTGLNLPVTSNTLNTMLAWIAIEGGNWGNSASFNPLNTTQSMPGSHTAPGTIVQAYPDWATGLAATIKTLKNGYYNTILNSLAANNPPQVTLKLPAFKTWGTDPAKWNTDNWAAYVANLNHRDVSRDAGSLGGLSSLSTPAKIAIAAGIVAAAFVTASYIQTGRFPRIPLLT